MIDSLWFVFAIPGLLLGMYAQFKLTSAYKKYSRIPTSNGISGAEAARAILDNAGLPGMPVNEVAGHLTDHYDPTKKALFLSSENFHGQTLAAVGVAAHEAGHALQHKASYAFLNFRMALVPVTKIASSSFYFIFLAGLLLNIAGLIKIAVALFAIVALFQLITLPVEFDASRRAKERLGAMGLLQRDELPGVSKVLGAAAMTYVAAMVSSVLQLVHLLLIARDRD